MEPMYLAMTSEFLSLNHQGSPWFYFFFNFFFPPSCITWPVGFLFPNLRSNLCPCSGSQESQTTRPLGKFQLADFLIPSLEMAPSRYPVHTITDTPNFRLSSEQVSLLEVFSRQAVGNIGKLRSSSPRILVSFPLTPSKLAGSRRVLSVVIFISFPGDKHYLTHFTDKESKKFRILPKARICS